ncbi:MAG: lamin tail domain-containing protein [Patescibacteria group bacterium]
MNKFILALFICALFSPFAAHAEVKINEVAWMGTSGSQYSEWIELYNSGEEAVPLAGWKLVVNGEETLYSLTKSIPAKSFLLVERTTASAPDAVPGVDDEAGTFGSGGLSNVGEDLSLKDDKGIAVDTLSYASAWPAGDAVTKDTMQRNGEQWITAPGTPRAENATQGTAPASETAEEKEEATSTAKSSPASGTASAAKKAAVATPPAPKKPQMTIVASKNILQGVPDEYAATIEIPDAMKGPQAYYYWNMGDGTRYVQPSFMPVSHLYRYPGTYTVTLAFYASPSASRPVLQATAAAVVSVPDIKVTVLNNGAAIEIENASSKAVDAGSWSLGTEEGTRILPPLTVFAPHAHIVMAAQTLGLTTIQHPVLYTPDGNKI